jgi:hypothetical protein
MKDLPETLLTWRDCLLPQRLRLQAVCSYKEASLRLHVIVLFGVGLITGVIADLSAASGDVSGEAGPIFGVKIPAGYRDWRLISVAHEEGKLNDIRAILAINAARERKLPYPDGTIIARLAWSYDPLAESSEAFGQPQSHVAGAPKNGVQFMVKDSRKYASTGGWGFAQFDYGKPASEAVHNTCFSCHAAVKARDFVFNLYAP